ncbi:MAG: heparinase II/III family protein, partial [Pirellulales bacterium]
FDTLNFDLYANGCKMMPDLGYPDFMNAFVSGIYTWSKNTISHNCVMIDRQRQTGNGPGSVELFVSSGGVHAVEVSAPSAYPGCREYRRGLILIETGPDTGYVVDISRVEGGKEHHYSLHGPPGEFTMIGGQWSDPVPGTLAGSDVAIGVPYDDPVLSEPEYHASFGRYKGSGFSHFTKVQTHRGGEWVAQYAHRSTPGSKIHLHVPPVEGQEILLAEAQVSPLKHTEIVKYVLDHRRGEDLTSVFVGVFEPFRQSPLIRKVRRHDVPSGVIVEVERTDALDVILFRTGEEATISHADCSTDGQLAVVTRSAGQVDRAVLAGGTMLRVGEFEIQHQPNSGEVVAMDPPRRSAEVRFEMPVEANDLVGRFLGFSRGPRTVWHKVTNAAMRGDAIRLTFGDDLLIGRAKVTSVDGKRVKTPIAFTFPPIYRGCVAADETFERMVGVESVGSTITLTEALPDGALTDADGDGVTDLWFCSFGLGATVTLPTVTAVTPR